MWLYAVSNMPVKEDRLLDVPGFHIRGLYLIVADRCHCQIAIGHWIDKTYAGLSAGHRTSKC